MSFPAVSKLSCQRHFPRLGDSSQDRLGPNGSFLEVLNPTANALSRCLRSADQEKLGSHSSERRDRQWGLRTAWGRDLQAKSRRR